MSKFDIKSAAVGALVIGGAFLAINAVNGGGRDAALIARIKDEVKATVSAEIRQNPKAMVESIEAYMRGQQEQAAKDADQQAVSKKAEIANAEGLPFLGNPDGKVQIVYFFDSNCVYCKRMDPVLKQIVAENPDVRVIHREIPILSETSRLAAQIGNVVWQFYPDKYRELHDRFLSHANALTADDIEDYLKLVMGSEEAATVLARANTPDESAVLRASARIKENLRIAQEAGVSGTPFLYVLQGDGIMRGAGEDAYDRVKSLVVKARSAAN